MKTLFLLNVTFNECECETNLEEVVLEECLEACPRKRQVEAQIQELKRSLVEVQTKLENEAEDKQRMMTRINEASSFLLRTRDSIRFCPSVRPLVHMSVMLE